MSANDNERDTGAQIPDDLPDVFADSARVVAESAGVDLNSDIDTETDQQSDDDTVTLRGLSDEALEYVLNTYDVELVE